MNIRYGYNQIKVTLICITVLIALNGCAAYYPQVVDAPLIKEKGDIRLNSGMFIAPGDSKSLTGGHATFSAGLTNMIAVQGYVSADFLSNGYAQGALGLFKAFDNNTVIELYSGYGVGGGDSQYEDNPYFKNLNYHLPFAQFNIGKTNVGSLHIDYGLSLKGGYLYTKYEEYEEPEPFYKEGWMFEPSLFFRLGGRRVKFSTKVNYQWNRVIEDEIYFPLSVSMGINFSLGKISK